MKKNLLTLGAIVAAAAPVVAVVSCGYTPATQKQIESYRNITSKAAIHKIEREWQNQLIDSKMADLFGGATTSSSINKKEEFAKAMIKYNVQKDPSYLRTIGTQILGLGKFSSKEFNADGTEGPSLPSGENVYSQAKLNDYGILKTYKDGIIDVEDTNVLKPAGLNLLMNEIGIPFQEDLNKFIIATGYLTLVKKEDWRKAFPVVGDINSLSDVEEKINNKEFMLDREAFSKRLFAQWSISLDTAKSSGFTGSSRESTWVDAIKQFDASQANTMAKVSVYSTRHKTYNASAINQNDLMQKNKPTSPFAYTGASGYQGISSLSGGSVTGTKDLSFTEDSYKSMDDVHDWEGFIQEGNIIDEAESASEKIKIMDDQATEAKLKYAKGFMPIWDSSNNVFTMFKGTAPASVDKSFTQAYAEVFALNDSELYHKAMLYYITAIDIDGNGKTDETIFEISDDEIRDLYHDKYSLEFVKSREPEDNAK